MQKPEDPALLVRPAIKESCRNVRLLLQKCEFSFKLKCFICVEMSYVSCCYFKMGEHIKIILLWSISIGTSHVNQSSLGSWISRRAFGSWVQTDWGRGDRPQRRDRETGSEAAAGPALTSRTRSPSPQVPALAGAPRSWPPTLWSLQALTSCSLIHSK